MSYDRLDGHVESALEAGQPPEHGFTHIGLYLGWLIRHDLHDPAFFPITHVEAVKAGEMTGSDLADDIDGKLVGLVMTAEGRAFSDARYEAYMAAYAAAFADAEPYAIADDDAAWARIDGRVVEWITIPEFSTAFWANDGLVVQVSGRADLVEAAIARLP